MLTSITQTTARRSRRAAPATVKPPRACSRPACSLSVSLITTSSNQVVAANPAAMKGKKRLRALFFGSRLWWCRVTRCALTRPTPTYVDQRRSGFDAHRLIQQGQGQPHAVVRQFQQVISHIPFHHAVPGQRRVAGAGKQPDAVLLGHLVADGDGPLARDGQA